jgi:hypothetical protein
MFFTKKKNPSIDLKLVRVPAKIIVLRKTDAAQEEALISDISRFANSQNAVKQSDLSANKPFHVELEKLALSTYCPDGSSRWFYERAAGSYKVMLERDGKTPGGIKRLQESIPPARKITKTDLAKFLCAWKQRPDLVSLGGQKNFIAFMDLISNGDSELISFPDSNSYKKIIAEVIIFKSVDKLVRTYKIEGERKYLAFQANITAYTVSVVSKLLGNNVDLDMIWKKQGISDVLGKQIITWSVEVNDLLHSHAKGRMISEWAKKSECWEYISRAKFSGHLPNIPELFDCTK